jgi:hypothetical protein
MGGLSRARAAVDTYLVTKSRRDGRYRTDISHSGGTLNNNTSPLSVTVNAGSATKRAWTHITTNSNGTPTNPCFFTCTYSSSFGTSKNWSANVSITDNFGNREQHRQRA